MQRVKSDQIESKTILAIQAFQQGQFRSIRAAARAYRVPHGRVTRRLKGATYEHDIRPITSKLTTTEEETLLERILDLDNKGFPARIAVVGEIANIILTARGDQPPVIVGKNWASSFVKRCPELRSTYSRKLDYKRQQCNDPALVTGWFRLVANTIQKYGILNQDIYNFDETGFQMGVISTSRVVTRAEKHGRVMTTQPGNREWVTVIQCINTQGWLVPPLIILKAKLHQATWYTTNNLPPDWQLAVSENGWTDDEIGFAWVQHFHQATLQHRIGRYRLLILDGHGSHHSARFEEFCKEHDIITLCMPPHSSHFLQPLDVGCFSLLKAAYGVQVERQIRLGINHISKEEFLGLYYEAHQAITPKSIINSFAATGLVPFNPDIVLSTLSPIRTPSPVISIGATWESQTPHTVAGLQHQARLIQEQRRSRKELSGSPSDEAFTKLLKGCEMALHGGAILLAENTALKAANERVKRQRKQKRSSVQKGGVLSIGEGRSQLSQVVPPLPRGNAAVNEDVQIASVRAPRRCSKCGSTTHTARTCTVISPTSTLRGT